MDHYVIDEFAQESFSDESVNVNCVLSWRTSSSKRWDGEQRLEIDFHNSVVFDSDYCRRGGVFEKIVQKLRAMG
jgi:hypothetical protein